MSTRKYKEDHSLKECKLKVIEGEKKSAPKESRDLDKLEIKRYLELIKNKIDNDPRVAQKAALIISDMLNKK